MSSVLGPSCWSPRRLAGGALLSVLLHALALGALALGAARSPVGSASAPSAQITTLWLLHAPPRVAAARMPPTVLPARAPARHHMRGHAVALASARPTSSPRRAPTPAASATRAVHGLAFAAPGLRIGLAPSVAPAATNAGPADAPPPPPPHPPPSWLMQRMQQVARMEFGQRLQQHLSALARPADTQPGHCRLASDDTTALVCDRPSLQAVVAADASALAALMRAYRGVVAPDATVRLAYEQERFRIELR